MLPFNRAELSIFRKLNTPAKIQNFLTRLPMNFEEQGLTCYSPRRVLRERKAHCLEGALLAAAALWFHKEPPLILDLRANPYDYDHVVALFRRRGRWGAISKTNHAVLRYREPVYKTVRELALSYFHEYLTDNGLKSLRSFSRPFDLRRWGRRDWVVSEDDLSEISAILDRLPHEEIVSPQMARRLRRADKIEIAAGKLVEWNK